MQEASAVLLLPLIAGLLRYAVSYGFEGKSKQECWRQFWIVALSIIVFICFPYLLWRLVQLS